MSLWLFSASHRLAGSRAVSAKTKSTDQQPPAPRRLLTYPEWAAENRCSVDTVRRKVERGELKVKRVSPGRVFIVEASA
jgi:hypothetical protein